jgi:hypothetical protein
MLSAKREGRWMMAMDKLKLMARRMLLLLNQEMVLVVFVVKALTA